MRRILYGLGIIAGAVVLFTWFMHRKSVDARTDAQTVSQALPAGDKEKVVIDEKRHELITVSRAVVVPGQAGKTITKKTFLASNASIETKPDGSVVVTSRSFGTIVSPWAGVSLDTEAHARLSLGVDLLYWQRWELGSGVSFRTSDLDPRVFVSVGYNVYSNLLLNATIDNHKAVGIGVALKF